MLKTAQKSKFSSGFLAILILSFTSLSSAYAQENYNFPDATQGMLGIKKSMIKIAAGDADLEKLRLVCTIAQRDAYWIRQERGRLAYNDLLQEITSEEQKRDIAELEKKLLPYEDCKKNVQLWNAYDDKWYAQERNRKNEAFLERQKAAVAQLKDSGADIWDGVIGSTVFAIPRQYMWFGSRRDDGLTTGINLRFYVPGLTARMDPDGSYGKHADIAGVLQRDDYTFTYPCAGFDGKEKCTSYMYQHRFVNNALDCLRGPTNRTAQDQYKSRWRHACLYRGDKGFVDKPVYDEEVGMMRMNRRAYFEGDPEFPTSYMLCPKPDTKDTEKLKELYHRCESVIAINENTYFTYGFPQALFWEHKKLQPELKKKIQSFIVTSVSPSQDGDIQSKE